MKFRMKICSKLIVLVLLLPPRVGFGQVPTRGNAFLGYSYASANLSFNGRTNLNGWNGSLEGKILPWVGIVADFSGLYGSQNVPIIPPISVTTGVHSFVFGPRASLAVGKFTPFVHALFGASHVNERALGFSGSDSSFATAWGGGVDYRLVHGIGWRVQADMLQTRFFHDTQNNFRLSTGVVLHF